MRMGKREEKNIYIFSCKLCWGVVVPQKVDHNLTSSRSTAGSRGQRHSHSSTYRFVAMWLESRNQPDHSKSGAPAPLSPLLLTRACSGYSQATFNAAAKVQWINFFVLFFFPPAMFLKPNSHSRGHSIQKADVYECFLRDTAQLNIL